MWFPLNQASQLPLIHSTGCIASLAREEVGGGGGGLEVERGGGGGGGIRGGGRGNWKRVGGGGGGGDRRMRRERVWGTFWTFLADLNAKNHVNKAFLPTQQNQFPFVTAPSFAKLAWLYLAIDALDSTRRQRKLQV